MSWTPRQKLSIGLLVVLALLSSLAWQIVERAVLVEEASSFLLPAFALGLTMATLFLGSLIWKEKGLMALAAAFMVIPSLFVAISLVHGIVLLVAAMVIYFGIRRIHSDMVERIHIAVRRSLLVGMGMVFLGVSLLLSSQYYVHVQQLSWEQLVPSFNLADGVGPIVLKVITPLYPEIGQLANDQVTVDGFLQDVQKREGGTLLDSMPLATQRIFLEQELKRTKKQLGDLLGREIVGNESMQSLLSEAVHRKTIAFFSGEQAHLPVPILPFFLSILLFLTVYPIMNFLAPILVVVVVILFRSFRLLHWLDIRQEKVEQEVLVD